MIIKPRIKGFVCITSHAIGCLQNIREQAAYAKNQQVLEENKPKRVLVIGSPRVMDYLRAFLLRSPVEQTRSEFILKDPLQMNEQRVQDITTRKHFVN